MAIYKLFPSQDSTIYSEYPLMNSGLDPILEINNINSPNGSPQVARSLIKFEQNEIDDILNNLVSGSYFEVFLKKHISDISGITQETILEIFPISGSWSNGTGRYLDSPINSSGVSWNYKNFNNNSLWDISNLNPYVKSSYINDNQGGGTWFTGSNDPEINNIYVTQSFNSRTNFDINVNITDIIKVWNLHYSNSYSFTDIANEGLIIKLTDDIEFNLSSSVQPLFKYYSIDTNTIYPPSLEIKWDDSVYNKGDLPLLTNENAFIGLGNNPNKFYPDSINKFRVNSRPTYPPRIYQTSSLYTRNYALPTSSYYAVKDLDTNEYVINFDENFTKISCDDSGSFFTLYMNGFEPERNYKILIKTIINGNTLVKDDNYYFKIIQN